MTIIRKLVSFIPKASGSDGNKIVLTGPASPQPTYYTESPDSEEAIGTYEHFPILLNQDGSPWVHGTLYLLSKLDSVTLPQSKTLQSIGGDLVIFKRFLDANSIDYTDFPKRKLLRPTFRFRAHLHELIEINEISPSTASRRMSSLIGFYRWLSKQHDIDFRHPPWSERDVYVGYSDRVGFTRSRPVKTTDLRISAPSGSDDYSGYIRDEGRLRPLHKSEQSRLVSALITIANPEMTLAFLIALTTGARMQTVFTLRLRNLLEANTDDSEVPIKVGLGTGIDTKYQKRLVIYMPTWLHNLVRAYVQSERASRRRRRSTFRPNIDGEQYIFLTQVGAPYYIASADPTKSLYRDPPRGNAVRQFINSRLIPALSNSDNTFAFRFHDLRATYGINLLEQKLAHGEKGRENLLDILMLIRERMGHSSIASTERYLNYRKKYELAIGVQSEFELHLRHLIESGISNA